MARNAPSSYGLTISCVDDADELFSTVDGIEGVVQDLIHRFTNTNVLGVNGEGWGEDVTKWPGMDPAKLARRGPVLVEVATRDPRIDTADVRVSATLVTRGGTLYAGSIFISAVTSFGPFRRVFGFNASTVTDITNALEGDDA